MLRRSSRSIVAVAGGGRKAWNGRNSFFVFLDRSVSFCKKVAELSAAGVRTQVEGFLPRAAPWAILWHADCNVVIKATTCSGLHEISFHTVIGKVNVQTHRVPRLRVNVQRLRCCQLGRCRQLGGAAIA